MSGERKLIMATLVALAIMVLVVAALCNGVLGPYFDPEPEVDFVLLPTALCL